METSEFKFFFEKIPHLLVHFIGVFPIDKLPTKIKKKQFFVANIDPSYKQGSHWIAFIRLNNCECEIFDSLGVNIKYLQDYFNFTHKLTFIYNSSPVQSFMSKLCGKFVITFLIERMLNQTMEYHDLLENVFCSDFDLNDKIVMQFCKNLSDS